MDKEGIENKIDGFMLGLTLDGEDYLKVKKFLIEFAIILEDRIVNRLGSQLIEQVKPLSKSREDYLQQEITVLSYKLMCVEESLLGAFLLRKINKRIKAEAEKKKEDKQTEVKSYVKELVKTEAK